MEAQNAKQEHTGSYYAATVNEVTDYPALAENISADICVVGAGFTGVATALTLAERGYSVALVEANRVGWGASGRNGGQLINGINGHDKIEKQHCPAVGNVLWHLGWRGHEIICGRVEKYGIDCDLKSSVGVVAPAESHVLAIEIDEAMVGDGALVGVAPEVGEDVGGAGERRFSILPIISNSRCATRTIHYSDKRPLCFARRPTTENAIFE